MNASRYVGRIGGLAVALGVGAALFTGNGIAWAGPASQDSSGSSTSGSQDSDASDSKPVKKTPASPFGRIKTSTRSGSTAASTSPGEGTTRAAHGPAGRHWRTSSAPTGPPSTPDAAISIGHQRVDIDDNAAQEEPVAVELDRRTPPRVSSGEHTQRHRRQRRRGEDAVDPDFIAEAERRVPQIASTFSTLSPVSIVKDSSGNAQCDSHATVGNGKRRPAGPQCRQYPCQLRSTGY